MAGQTIVLADTAGLRATEDVIEAEGVRRAEAWARSADLRIGVVDGVRPETAEAVLNQLGKDDLIILNKSDLFGEGGATGLRPPYGQDRRRKGRCRRTLSFLTYLGRATG